MSRSLSALPQELTYGIFKLLDRPSKLSLGLTSPYFLHLFAKYYDLERYRNKHGFTTKLGLSPEIHWNESAAQPVIIRWLSMPGGDDIDDLRVEESDHEDYDSCRFCLEFAYGSSKDAKEDVEVENILTQALNTQFGVNGKVISCSECYRYMRVSNRKRTPFAKNMQRHSR